MSFYAVRKGRKAGVYESWAETKEQVDGFPGAVFKKFESYNDAEDYAFPNVVVPADESANEEGSNCMVAYTDGSFVDNKAGWGYILLKNNKPFFEGYGQVQNHFGMRNIASEIEAAKRAIQRALALGASRLDIYHDYEGVGRWPDGDWKTNRYETEKYALFVNQMRKQMEIHFHKVKGHSNDELNDRADTLALAGVASPEPVEKEIVSVERESEKTVSSVKEQGMEETPSTCENKCSDLQTFLKAWRNNAGLSISAAAKETGFASYARLENGEDVKISAAGMRMLYSVCGAGVSRQEFLEMWVKLESSEENEK